MGLDPTTFKQTPYLSQPEWARLLVKLSQQPSERRLSLLFLTRAERLKGLNRFKQISLSAYHRGGEPCFFSPRLSSGHWQMSRDVRSSTVVKIQLNRGLNPVWGESAVSRRAYYSESPQMKGELLPSLFWSWFQGQVACCSRSKPIRASIHLPAASSDNLTPLKKIV